ncbi:MAG: hypothetical protein GY906_07730, partial [bacterium]|nr:hypothetical protein [bacterium]
MLAGRDARITYLDLRGATTAQALGWILRPLRLTWQPEPSRGPEMILVGSDRRMPRISAWVYDVSVVALPSQKELEKTGDWEKAVAKAKEEAEQFVDAVRGALRASEDEITWYAPGHLLVIGSPQTHEKMAGVIAQLSNPMAKPAGTLAVLHAKTGRRAKERQAQVEKLGQLNRLMEVAAVHDAYGW